MWNHYRTDEEVKRVSAESVHIMSKAVVSNSRIVFEANSTALCCNKYQTYSSHYLSISFLLFNVHIYQYLLCKVKLGYNDSPFCMRTLLLLASFITSNPQGTDFCRYFD